MLRSSGDENRVSAFPVLKCTTANSPFRPNHTQSKKASLVKVGCVARLVEVLQTQVSPATSPSTADDEKNEPIVQALVALGSFAYGSDVGLRAVLESNALNVILSDRILGVLML